MGSVDFRLVNLYIAGNKLGFIEVFFRGKLFGDRIVLQRELDFLSRFLLSPWLPSRSGAMQTGRVKSNSFSIGGSMRQIHLLFSCGLLLVLLFYFNSYAQNPCPGTPTVTYLGKTYNTVLIGSQCWLKENLNVGAMVDSLQIQTNNSVIEKYCYHNDTNNCNTYGGLYQWNEAMQYSTAEGTRGICPSGWHIPAYAEFQTLITAVGGDGNALKDTTQGTEGGKGTNTSGFSALLSGYLSGVAFYSYDLTYFWSSTEYNASHACSMYLYYYDSSTEVDCGHYPDNGYCVPCVKDNAVGVDDKYKSELPKEYMLFQNNPNPFNPQTKISHSVPKESYITLKVYDLLGREVATLIQEKKERGEYSVIWKSECVPSGVYFYRLIAGDFVETKKMIAMK
jgi:uncharacterized protein (TIGR02145 family)